MRYEAVADPAPGTGQVVVDVAACGLNHLDLWLEENGLPVKPVLPRIQGCEVAGRVALVGEGVQGWREGDAVAVQSNLFCGRCEFCERGEESLCLQGKLLGVDCDGGFAERLLVPADALVAVPEGVDLLDSAALTLAGSTAMHMLTDRVQVREGDWVLVMGAASGVGSAAIQIARHRGARVITTGRTEAKRELGLTLGAEHAVDTSAEKWMSEVRRMTGRRGVDVIVEHVGGVVLEQCFHCLARGGAIVTCGATAGREVKLDLWPLFVKQQRLVGSYGRNRSDMAATLQAVAEGWLRPVVHQVYEMQDTARAFADLRSGRVLGKAVIRCGPV
jgi:NADPH:quinone reductase-like Zn-dependent oxidoreductase